MKTSYHDLLEKIARLAKLNPSLQVRIAGHTDSIGTVQVNDLLSQKRAESVKNYLLRVLGVSPQQIYTRGFGFSRSIADNATAEGRRKNRRAVTIVVHSVAANNQ